MTPPKNNVHPFPPKQQDPPERLGPIEAIQRLHPLMQSFLALGTLGALLVGGVRGCDAKASRAEVSQAFDAAKHALQQHEIGAKSQEKEQDEDIDLLFQTTVKLTTDVDYLKEEVRGIRLDIRDMDAGRSLKALPPSPSPTPRGGP